MNICLVRPPTFVDAKTYPYNIECISAALKQKNHAVSFVDGEYIAHYELAKHDTTYLLRILDRISINKKILRQTSLVNTFFGENSDLFNNICLMILNTNPSLIGFSCYSASMSSTAMIVRELRRKHNYNGKIVLGGIHPTSMPLETFEAIPEIDFIVSGEGEETIVDLTTCLETNKDYTQIDGISWKDSTKVHINNNRSLINDLSKLPQPSFEFADSNSYNFTILTSRGCPFHCDYCASKVVFGKTVRFRPAKSICDEIQMLIENYNVKGIRFGDDTFTVNRKHLVAVHDEIKKRGINIELSVGSRIDTIDDEKIEILKSMGVTNISFGIESGSPTIQRSVHKGLNLDTVVPTIKKVNDAGIYSITFFILNHPGETEHDMHLTASLVKKLLDECNKNEISVNTGFPYPSTPWWDYTKANNLQGEIDFYKYSHTYNHQQKPIVNMTNMDDNIVYKYHTMLSKLMMKTRYRNLLKKSLKNPRKAIEVLLKQ